MDVKRIFAATATAIALVAAPLAPALAQEAAPVPQMQPEDVSDEMLTAFAMAALTVSEVAESYRSRIGEAQDDAARQQDLQQQAQEEMVQAVEDTDGITVEEYVAISDAARADAALNERVMSRIEEVSTTE